MKKWTRWQDWTTAVLGVALIFVPWVLGVASTTAFAVNAWFIGVLAVAVALFSLSQPRRIIAEWITLLLGTWLFLSPWLFSFTTVSAATGACWVIGLLLIVTSGWILGEAHRFQAGVPT